MIIFTQTHTILKLFCISRVSKCCQLNPEKHKLCFIPFISMKINILGNFDFVFLKDDIHRFISSTKLFFSNVRGLRYTGTPGRCQNCTVKAFQNCFMVKLDSCQCVPINQLYTCDYLTVTVTDIYLRMSGLEKT